MGKGLIQGSSTQRPLPPQTEKLKLDREGREEGRGGYTYSPSQGPTHLHCLNGNEKVNFLFFFFFFFYKIILWSLSSVLGVREALGLDSTP